MLIIKYRAERDEAKYIIGFKGLPNELHTGLVPRNKGGSLGDVTFSPNTVDPLLANGAILGIALFIAYLIQMGLESILTDISISLFSMAIIARILVQIALTTTGGIDLCR